MSGPQAHVLPDGRRLHLNHGPIDLIVEAFGQPSEVECAYRQAVVRFAKILDELVAELPGLRRPSSLTPRHFTGSTARRMEAAVSPLARKFITPMAAVAGSVADEILSEMVNGRTLDKAYVNDGGDIALYLAPGHELNAAIAGIGNGVSDRIVIRADDPVRGIATSGWRGRSFSLGIADAVTVLARSGAEADAAATIIANAVDLPGHLAVRRQPAREMAPDSDLGDKLVTVDVGPLSPAEIASALDAGLIEAERLRQRGLIVAAAMFLRGEVRTAGNLAAGNHPLTGLLRKPPLPRPGGEETPASALALASESLGSLPSREWGRGGDPGLVPGETVRGNTVYFEEAHA